MKNDVEFRGDHAAVIIRRNDGTILEALVDSDDVAMLREFGATWHAAWHPDVQNYRVKARKNTKGIQLPRLLLNAPNHLQVDHINHDTMDNRRSNLRLVTASRNQRNRKGPRKGSRSGVRGVSFDSQRMLYEARFMRHGETIHLGYFRKLGEAAKAARDYLANEKAVAS